MKVIVTGGLGYIGSHVVVALVQAGHEAVIVDDLSNSVISTADALDEFTGVKSKVHLVDVAQVGSPYWSNLLYGVDAVIHMAGRKAVGESVEDPLLYYQQNVSNTIALLQAMQKVRIRTFVFSSSAAVYALPAGVIKRPLLEQDLIRPASPYGATKHTVERILSDCTPFINSLSLRYFNPIGAHESGELAESGQGRPNNLFPRILDVALGKADKIRVFGDGYQTHDGTCIRDYIHVMDVAEAHVKALEYLAARGRTCPPMNLGTGKGTSVLDLIVAFETATGVKIPYEIAAHRPGDTAYLVANAQHAQTHLNWTPSRTIADACRDGWRAAQRNQ